MVFYPAVLSLTPFLFFSFLAADRPSHSGQLQGESRLAKGVFRLSSRFPDDDYGTAEVTDNLALRMPVRRSRQLAARMLVSATWEAAGVASASRRCPWGQPRENTARLLLGLPCRPRKYIAMVAAPASREETVCIPPAPRSFFQPAPRLPRVLRTACTVRYGKTAGVMDRVTRFISMINKHDLLTAVNMFLVK